MSSSEPIRVAHIMGKMHGGGVESVVMNYYRHIDRSHVQFDFLVDEDSTIVPRNEIESLGGCVFPIPPYQQLTRYMDEIEGLFYREGWQVVHSHINSLSVFPLRAAKRANVPVRIAHSHSSTGKGERLPKLFMKQVLRCGAGVYPTHCIACGELAGRWLFGEGRYKVFRNAIDLGHFAYSPVARKQIRDKLGIPDDCFLVGHVGRFSPPKNQKWLSGVLNLLLQKVPNTRLVFVGEGPDRLADKAYFEAAGQSSSVMFAGQCPDSAPWYSAFDAFVLPSLYEGLPLVAVEAQRSGLPCVFSDRVTREVEVSDRVDFLSLNDCEVWADVLASYAVGNQPRELSGHDPRFAGYDIDVAAPRLVDFYLKVLKEARS